MIYIKNLPKTKLVNRTDFILNKSTNQNVLNLGPVDRIDPNIPIAFLHRKIIKVSNSVVGIDLDKKGIDIAKKEGIQNIIWGNLKLSIKFKYFLINYNWILALYFNIVITKNI